MRSPFTTESIRRTSALPVRMTCSSSPVWISSAMRKADIWSSSRTWVLSLEEISRSVAARTRSASDSGGAAMAACPQPYANRKDHQTERTSVSPLKNRLYFGTAADPLRKATRYYSERMPQSMESQAFPQADTRLASLQSWLSTLPAELGADASTLRTASSDASFRRYFRIDIREGTAIIMDAPPSHEDCGPFLHVGRRLQEAGLNVPRILAEDLEQGFLLLSEPGTHTYLQRLREGIDDTTLQRLYRPALHELVRMQQARTDDLPAYDVDRLGQELTVFNEWYVEKHCQATLSPSDAAALAQVFATLTADNASQPTVLVHRDYHSPNLMLPQADGDQPGVIDFQDAVAGPITYDIASLVTDARHTWEEEQQLDWAIRYWEA